MGKEGVEVTFCDFVLSGLRGEEGVSHVPCSWRAHAMLRCDARSRPFGVGDRICAQG